MVACATCGSENAVDARFCSACGAVLDPDEPTRNEVRKTVTVLFSDVVGSTAVGERLDPESLRRVMGRYFEEMAVVLQRHGGMVEKFIGDAIMAVFGVPVLHEDDALRAVRAAAEMRDRLGDLNQELERDHGVRLENRTGINTGEVVAGDHAAGQRLVTGDAVNVAARLEQNAAPGEILLGADTRRLVRDAVRVEQLEPFPLRGKAEPVRAYRLQHVLADAPAFARRLDAPFVGRGSELEFLRAELARCIAERSCRLVTVLGPPGIGKSRLVHELVAGRGTARFLVGRCLPYGEGITYWPLVEIVKQIAGDDASSVADLIDEDRELVAERIAAVVGQGEIASAPEESFWAVRRLLEAVARERPLVVVLDDLEWAQPTFLDLVEYVLGFASNAAILVLAVARPDLLESRPSWTNPRPNASTVVLEPLSETESDALVDRLLTDATVSDELRSRIVEAAEGNPLFVEQMLAMRSENENGTEAVPPTIQALLAARIDHLEPDERGVIERASVEGRLFHRGAVADLVPPHVRSGVGSHLMTLVRKEFIRPDRAEFPGDDAFRFGHLLIRDAAYASMSKQLRAELHERFADWLERKVDERRVEYEEILGYHLEQSYRYRMELGPADERTQALCLRASDYLSTAGERALARADLPAATNLLGRAIDLFPEEGGRSRHLRLALGDTLIELGNLEQARKLLDELSADAAAAGDEALEWRARVARAWVDGLTLSLPPPAMRALVDQALAALTKLGDEDGLARAWRLASHERNMAGDTSGIGAAMRKALVHARRAGNAGLETEALFWIGLTAFFDDTPVTEGLVICEEIAQAEPTPLRRAHALLWTGAIRVLGAYDDGLPCVASARALYRELGLRTHYGGTAIPHGLLYLVMGRPEEAEPILREGAAELELAGEKGYRSAVLVLLALALCRRGRHDEADGANRDGEALTERGDLFNFSLISSVRAEIAAGRGDLVEAEQAAREAVILAERPGGPEGHLLHGEILLTLADVLRSAGKTAESREAAERALSRYKQKGAVPGIERARGFLAELTPA